MFSRSHNTSVLPKTPSLSATKHTPITYGGDKQPTKYKSSATNNVSQTQIIKSSEKTVFRPPKHLGVTDDIKENKSFDRDFLTHDSTKREGRFDGKDKINYPPSQTSYNLVTPPKGTDKHKELKSVNNINSPAYTQSVLQETNNKYKQKPVTLTNPSEIQTGITRHIPHTTSQQYTDTPNKHQPTANKQTILSDWDTNTSPDIITSISQHTPHNIPHTVAKQPIECKPIRGLRNLGNTCFMNCILQCLSHTIPLRQFYITSEYKQFLDNRRGTLSFIFRNVMLELWEISSDSFAPYDLKRQVGIVAPRFSGYNQHDAQEFMRFLLNELHDEINKANVKTRLSPVDNESLDSAIARYLTWENSRISDLFSGMLRSTVCCSKCGHTSTVFDPYMDLALPIPKKKTTRPYNQYSISYDSTYDTAVQLDECLQIFTAEETLDAEERPYCAKCKKLTTSTKQLAIARLPTYLVIQLKRFSGYHVRTKLSTPVLFDDTWALKDSDGNTHTYSLYGIVSHSGGIYGGHYVAYCKYKNVWRSFNDTLCRGISWEHVKVQEAYILFYEKED